MSVPNHWLLGWWYPRRLRVHQQRYRHGDSNENVCSTKTTTWLHTMPYSIIYHCKFKRSLNNYLIIKIMSLEEKRQMQLHCIYIIHPGYSGFVLLVFCPLFIWPLCCLSFSDLRNLITPLVSSNSSYRYLGITITLYSVMTVSKCWTFRVIVV